MSLLALLVLACTSTKTTDDSGAPSGDSDPYSDSGSDSDIHSGDTDSAVDTSAWACGDDGLSDPVTLCYQHALYTCELRSVGLRRGDWLCWPPHAFCPEPGVYCSDTTEGWASVPLAYPDDFKAVAEGVLNDPETVFSSPIDDGFTPTRTVEATTITEAYYAFYYDEVTAGEEVVLANGTYNDCYIGFEGEGEPGRPLVLRAETPGGVTLNNCSIYMDGSYLVLSGFRFTGKMVYTPIAMGYTDAPCDHCAVRDVTIDTVWPDAPVNRPYVQIYGRGNEVSDSSFIAKANTTATITIDRPDPSTPLEARIYRNYFADRTNTIAEPGVTNGFEVIRAGYSMDYFYPGYVIIEGNLFERNDGELETISLKSGNNAVRFNTFRDNAGQISVRDGFGNVVEGNYILGEDKAWSGGIRASAADTLIVGNHIQDIVPNDSRYRYPVALLTGTDDLYENYTSTFESAVLFNRAISPLYGFALDNGEDYPPTFYPPYDNLYAQNLYYTGGAATVLGYTFDESLTGNTISDNWLDVDLGIDGFEAHTETATEVDGLLQVSAFEAAISGAYAMDMLSESTLETAERALVLQGPEIYTQVPLLEEGDVGGP